MQIALKSLILHPQYIRFDIKFYVIMIISYIILVKNLCDRNRKKTQKRKHISYSKYAIFYVFMTDLFIFPDVCFE